MAKIINDLSNQQPANALDVDLSPKETRDIGAPSSSAVRGGHVEAEALKSVRDQAVRSREETRSTRDLPKLIREEKDRSTKAADQARQDLITQVEGDEKVSDVDRNISNQQVTERIKEQEVRSTVNEGAALASRRNGGDGGGDDQAGKQAVKEGLENAKLSKDQSKTAAAEQRRQLIDQVEADEKVEDNSRIQANQEQTKLIRGVESPQGAAGIALRAGESSSDGSQKGNKTETKLAQPKLLKAKVISSAAKEKAKENVAKQLREISEGELAEKVEDQAAKYQKQTQDQQRQAAQQTSVEVATAQRVSNEVHSKAEKPSIRRDSSGRGDDENDTSTEETQSAGGTVAAKPEQERPQQEQQQVDTELALQQQVDRGRKRAVEDLSLSIDEVSLEVSYGFDPDTFTEIHRDARDIRVLLVMADAYKRMREHIESDVLAANVASDSAASFAATNIAAVQVASERFREHVGEVLPWQRFGAF